MLNELSHNFDSNGEFSKVSAVKKALDILAERDNKGENTSKTTDLSDIDSWGRKEPDTTERLN